MMADYLTKILPVGLVGVGPAGGVKEDIVSDAASDEGFFDTGVASYLPIEVDEGLMVGIQVFANCREDAGGACT